MDKKFVVVITDTEVSIKNLDSGKEVSMDSKEVPLSILKRLKDEFQSITGRTVAATRSINLNNTSPIYNWYLSNVSRSFNKEQDQILV